MEISVEIIYFAVGSLIHFSVYDLQNDFASLETFHQIVQLIEGET